MAFERLEPYDGKLSRTVLRGDWSGNTPVLPGPSKYDSGNVLMSQLGLIWTFRLKKDLSTSFKTKEKRMIVFEWLLGVLVYIAFLALAKSGSVLHTLKSLFVG